MKHVSYSENDIKLIGKSFAKDLSKEKTAVILLEGDLGAGKTVFARELIKEMINNPDATVPSPTFTLVQTYEYDEINIWHFDLYRLEYPEEVIELGFDDALAEGIVIIEWAERLGYLLPDNYIKVTINHDEQDNNKRLINIENFKGSL